MRRLVPVVLVLGLLLGLPLVGGCAALKAAFKVGNPTAGRDQMIGLRTGDGDGIVSWIAVAGLTVVALSAYPTQRAARLAWNSWRGRSGNPKTRSRKGREMCIKSSEWDS